MDEEFGLSPLANITLDDELTPGASSSLAAHSEEPSVDPAHLSAAPAGDPWVSSSTASFSRVSSAEGSVVQAPTGTVSPSDSKSPSLMGMSFLKGLGGGVQKKVTTRDGQPAKRRGPKPDSKPAQTRRQELNRQAQRTHRERKEQYIKALETEISKLREGYSSDIATVNSSLQQHKEALREHKDENTILKEILAANGIQYDAELDHRKAAKRTGGSFSSSTAGSRSGTYHLVTPATTTTSGLTPPSHGIPDPRMGAEYLGPPPPGSEYTGLSHGSGHPSQHTHYAQQAEQPGMMEQVIKREDSGVADLPGVFEQDPQLSIDFILALESSCRQHTELLCRRSGDSPSDTDEALFSGHALMASCPPPTYLADPSPSEVYPHKTYDLPPANLSTLLNLSQQLVTEGEITPTMALHKVKTHARYRSLTKEDIRGMIDDLNAKVRCYGFGAVLENFEVMDALSSILATKLETYAAFTNQDDAMYT